MKTAKNTTKSKQKDMLRTDLALEFGLEISSELENDIVKQTSISITKELSKQIGKPEGDYITIETSAVLDGNKHEFTRVAEAIANAIKRMEPSDNTLIVGLGNPDMTADSLGKRVLRHVMITRHLNSGESDGIPRISGIYPNVLGVTGIESFDIIKGVASRSKPDSIIVIDSLAGATVGRIASAFQVSNAGITPGSGISNHRTRLDEKSLGVPVISVGVPLVVYASTIISDAFGGNASSYDKSIGNMVVTPKDIDIFVTDCAHIIARAINIAFFDTDFDGLM
ncbi:MAG: GPR endopeptidase [Firmicutes bacterium]|nr:GPR endopeptidase [Bacillota bacterium]